MTKDEFLQMSDDEKWDLYTRQANTIGTFCEELLELKTEVSMLKGDIFSEEDIIKDLQGKLMRKLKKYEKKKVKSFFAYAERRDFKWKDGSIMIRSDVSNYLFIHITRDEIF